MEITHRLATRDDLPSLEPMVTRAIDELQRDYLDATQIAASHAIMGLDTQLIDDGTYFVIEGGGALAGAGAGAGAPPCSAATTRPAETRISSTRRSTLRASARCTPTQTSPGVASAGSS